MTICGPIILVSATDGKTTSKNGDGGRAPLQRWRHFPSQQPNSHLQQKKKFAKIRPSSPKL
jgi:hypothetical protein